MARFAVARDNLLAAFPGHDALPCVLAVQCATGAAQPDSLTGGDDDRHDGHDHHPSESAWRDRHRELSQVRTADVTTRPPHGGERGILLETTREGHASREYGEG